MTKHCACWGSIALLLGVLLFARNADAQPSCDDSVNLPNPVYLTVGDTQANLMRELGAKLRATEQITLIWRATGSDCVLGFGVQSLFKQAKLQNLPTSISTGKCELLAIAVVRLV